MENKKGYMKSFADNVEAFLEHDESKEINSFISLIIRHYRNYTESKDAPVILELGSGPGDLSKKLLFDLKPKKFVALDFNPAMVERLRMEISTDKYNLQIVEADMLDFEQWKGRYDIIVSSFSFHHIKDDNRKALFKICRERLNTGGIFINGDIFDDEDSECNDFIVYFRDHSLQQDLDPAQLEARKEHRKFEHRCSVKQQLQDLNEAGFESRCCIYKKFYQAVVIAS